MYLRRTKIPGCHEITPRIFKDERGIFVKTFNKDIYTQEGLVTCFPEEYYSVSHKNVLRGMHFQSPPKEHTKLVYCVFGEVIDAVVDLRIGSPAYGKFELFDLSAEKANIIYISPGLAHGFYVVSEKAILLYKVSTMYSPEYDTGIHWNSVSIPWPNKTPIVSQRDDKLSPFLEFRSPFFYAKG